MPVKKKEPQKNLTTDLNLFLGEIKQKAQEIYIERQRKNLPGDEVADWLKAEAIVKKAHNIK